jgi:hypothetical protein
VVAIQRIGLRPFPVGAKVIVTQRAALGRLVPMSPLAKGFDLPSRCEYGVDRGCPIPAIQTRLVVWLGAKKEVGRLTAAAREPGGLRGSVETARQGCVGKPPPVHRASVQTPEPPEHRSGGWNPTDAILNPKSGVGRGRKWSSHASDAMPTRPRQFGGPPTQAGLGVA